MAAEGGIRRHATPGRTLSGVVSDAIGWRSTLSLAVFGMAVSTLWLLFLDANWMLYGFVLCYGLCHGLRIPAQLGIVSDFFGTTSLGILIGITTAVGQIAGAFAFTWLDSSLMKPGSIPWFHHSHTNASRHRYHYLLDEGTEVCLRVGD